MWWEEYPPPQTILVWEDTPEKVSTILDVYGNPYIYRKQYKIGFDLSERESNDAKQK